jgi:CHAD domain-containing protein
MPYRLKRRERVADGIQRIAEEQIDRALTALRAPKHGDGIHQARRRLKMVRAVLRLVRPALDTRDYERENLTFRDLGRQLSQVRDADVLVNLIDSFAPERAGDAAFRHVARRISAHRQTTRREFLDSSGDMNSFRDALSDGRERVPDWSRDVDRRTILKGLQRSYRRAREGFTATGHATSEERWHEWRKRTKDFGYHLRLFQPVWPGAFDALHARCSDLSHKLGDEHDLAVLEARLSEFAPERAAARELGRIRQLIERRRETLHEDARAVGQSLFAEKPRTFTGYVNACWHEWRATS